VTPPPEDPGRPVRDRHRTLRHRPLGMACLLLLAGLLLIHILGAFGAFLLMRALN
jgi:hypothetical protein